MMKMNRTGILRSAFLGVVCMSYASASAFVMIGKVPYYYADLGVEIGASVEAVEAAFLKIVEAQGGKATQSQINTVKVLNGTDEVETRQAYNKRLIDALTVEVKKIKPEKKALFPITVTYGVRDE